MNSVWNIYFWHGKTNSLVKKIEQFCVKNDKGDFTYTGSIDTFIEKYKGNILVHYKSKTIGITNFNSFSAR